MVAKFKGRAIQPFLAKFNRGNSNNGSRKLIAGYITALTKKVDLLLRRWIVREPSQAEASEGKKQKLGSPAARDVGPAAAVSLRREDDKSQSLNSLRVADVFHEVWRASAPHNGTKADFERFRKE